jgi:hypothetical protein
MAVTDHWCAPSAVLLTHPLSGHSEFGAKEGSRFSFNASISSGSIGRITPVSTPQQWPPLIVE